MIKFRHISSASTFNSLKFSAGKNNTQYYIGKNPEKHTGVPDVLYTEIAFCRELKIIYTHGGFYENQVGSYLKQIDNLDGYLQAANGEIVEYIGQTNGEYVNGYLYRNVVSQTSIPVRRILTTSNENILQQGDTLYFKQELSGETVYSTSDRKFYCYKSPIIGTKIYEATDPVNEFVITSTTPVTGGYQVNYSPVDDYSTTSTIKLLGMLPKMLWVSTSGVQVCAAPPNDSLTGIVEVEGNRYVNVTSEFVQNKNNYWELVLPSSISGGGSTGGFRKVQVNNSEIDSVNYDSFKIKDGNGIKLECRNNEIVINRLSEINDLNSSSTSTWSSEKINSVISAFLSNTFLVVDELPTTDINPKVIYIVPKEGGESPNLREEYVYINGSWELIGSTEVDLSNYYTIQEVNNKLADKQDKLTAIGVVNITDNNISVDLTQFYTRDAVDSKLAVKQNIVTGSEGEVLYHNGSDVFTQFVMSDGYVAETADDLALCKNFRPSFKDIFETWYQFSHLNGTDHAGVYGTNGDYYWVYDDQTERIRETRNSNTYTGYVSPRSYSNYDVTVRCFSTDGDDDTIGLVAAFAKDANGREHTLSFLRTPGGTVSSGNGRWFAVLDYSQFTISNNSATGQTVLAVKEYAFPPKRGWNYSDPNYNPPIDMRPGTIIRMVRNGNVFTAKCSQFGSNILDPNSTITIDLDQLSDSYPVLSLFKGSASWGYSCMSQTNSQYENISVTDPSALIFDTLNNQVWSYDPLHDNGDGSLGDWVVVPGSPINMMGIGRFNYNSITDKLFFNNGKKIIRIANKLTAGDNVKIVNDVISAIVPVTNDGLLTVKQGDATLGTFSANQETDSTINIPVPAAPGNGTLTITRGSDTWTFTANQSTNTNVNIPVPATPGNGTVTIKQGSTTLGTFTLNQSTNETVNIPEPAVPGNGTITIKQGDATLGSFTLNQVANGTINIPVPATPGNGTITIKQGDTTLGTFTLNQSTNGTVNIPEPATPGNGTITIKQGSNVLGTFSMNQGTNDSIDIPVPAVTPASSYDIKDLADSTSLRQTWSGKQDPISGTGVISVNNNVVSADLSEYETIADVNTKLATKQNSISGQEGEIVYHNGTDVFTQTLMSGGYVVNTNEDLAKCKLTNPSFRDVFTSWKMFSHTVSGDNANADDMAGWSYVESANTINQSRNSASYTGYVSPISYSNYEVTVRVYSSDGDDDFNGIVAAYAKDSNGKEHTLSFLRTPNGTGINWTNTGWVCLLDFRAQAKASLSGTTAIIQEIVNTDTNPESNWRNFYTSDSVGGTVITVKRIGNRFIAKCSAFGSTTLLDSTEIVVDLDDTSLTTQYPTLNLFKGSAPWGYSTYSQANSRYANISITDDSRRIFDALNNEVWSYGTSGWEIETGKEPITEMGIGRLNFNTVTKKLFYNNGREIQELSASSSSSPEFTQLQSDWSQTDSTSAAFIKNKPTIPAPQIQADWNQTNNSALDYIKNKPAIPVVDSVDINVTSWGSEDDLNYWYDSSIAPTSKTSLLYAVGMSLKYNSSGIYTRIHIIKDFDITTDTELDTSNCEILGHDRTIAMKGHSIKIKGKFFKVMDLRIRRADDNDPGESTLNTELIKLRMTESVCYLVFNTVTFFNWPIMSTSLITNGVAYPESFNFVEVSGGTTSSSAHIICQNCQFPVRPTRLGTSYKSAILNADYSHCLIRCLVNGSLGAYSIEMTNNIGGIQNDNGVLKQIIGPQQVIVKLSSIISEDMFLYSDGTVDYRYTINSSTDTTTPVANGYYPNHKCRVWYGVSNSQLIELLSRS
jgi:hypothetical protein